MSDPSSLREPVALPQPRPRGRLGGMLAALSLGVALTGYLIAVNTAPVPTRSPERSDAPTATDVRPAPRYLEIERGALGANAGWRSALDPAALRDGDATRFYGSLPADGHARAAALFARSERRAYRGAPPMVPHSIDQTGTQACLACHEHGLRVGDVVVPPMSHRPMTNCTQCHAEASGAPPVSVEDGAAWTKRGDDIVLAARPARPQPMAPNTFRGLDEPGPGSRAYVGAPPTIPHSTFMRESCTACHGVLASEGLRSSHPWRANCVQCHAPSAELDQVPVQRSPLPALR